MIGNNSVNNDTECKWLKINTGLESKGGKTFSKQAGVATVTSDKVDFRLKSKRKMKVTSSRGAIDH
jgi:hypothetical protein